MYFENPQYVLDTFFVGLRTIQAFAPFGPLDMYEYAELFNPSANSPKFIFQDDNGYFIIDCNCDGNRQDITENSRQYCYSWGGPFPILTPPPCMVPHDVRVTQLGYDSVTLAWDLPVAVPYCRFEYGPAGFAEGSGITIDSLTEGRVILHGLEENTEYEARVRSWCRYDTAFSDTVSIRFTTMLSCNPVVDLERFFVGDTSINVLWYRTDSAEYSEALWGPAGFAEGDGEYRRINPTTTGLCVLSMGDLQPGTEYEVYIRNYCYHSDTVSSWLIIDTSTLGHFMIAASSNNPEWGTVEGEGIYVENTTATLKATPLSEVCHFVGWSDGDASNPRRITVERYSSFVALFSNDTVPEGIVTALDESVRLYPNPATQSVTVSSQSPMTSVEISDMLGRKIIHLNHISAESITIPVGNLPKGIYIATVQTTESKTVIKLILK